MQPLSPLKGETNGSQKKVKVFFEKIWKFQKLALPLQPLSASKTGRWFSKKMLKIFSKRFGSLEKLPYLCNRFPLLKSERGTEIKRTSVLRYNSFFEVFEQLNKFFPHSQECNFKTITFEIRAKIYKQFIFTMESLILAQDER